MLYEARLISLATCHLTKLVLPALFTLSELKTTGNGSDLMIVSPNI